MRIPRLSISGLMAVVLIVALDLGFGIALNEPPLLRMPRSELLIIGGFPMANVLAVAGLALVAAWHEAGPRRAGLIGLVAAGGLAWLAFLACALLFDRPTHGLFLDLGRAMGLRPGLEFASLAAALYLAPQAAVATLGWKLGRKLEPAAPKPRPIEGLSSRVAP